MNRVALDLRPTRTSPPETASTIEARMVQLGVPGVAVALMTDGRIEEVGCFGMTRAGGPSVSTETLFQAASVSKPVTALAALRLVEAGYLDLDADIACVLKGWTLPGSSHGAGVTLRRLLNHSAGTTVHGFPGYHAGSPLPTLLQILDGMGPCNSPPVRVDLVPGTAFRYSGGGYQVVQKILEDIAGKPFAEVASEWLFAPLGMADSTFEQPLALAWADRAASPHDAAGDPLPEGAHVHPELAAAGLWTTPADLARFSLAVQRAAGGEAGGILSPGLARRMLESGPGSQGLGFAVAGDPSRAAFGHGGANAGFRSWFWVQVAGPGLVVMTNGDNGQAIAEQLYWAGERAGLLG